MAMKTLVIGANGKVGRQVVQLLAKSEEHEPIAMIRDSDQIPFFEDMGVKTVLADLDGNFSHAFSNCDAVIFAAGSGPNTGADKTIIIDQEGAIKAAEEAQRREVKRFILLSSMGTDHPEEGSDSMKFYFYAKRRADEFLKGTNLNYTIVRPGGLTNDNATGKVKVETSIKSGERKIPRADVADVLVQSLSEENTSYKTFEIVAGEKNTDQALANL